MTEATDLLRQLPAVDDVLRHQDLAAELQRHAHSQLVSWIRAAIDQTRQEIIAEKISGGAAMVDHVIQRVRQHCQQEAGAVLQPVINATGVLLHTNLGRAPLAERAIQRMEQASRYANVELNLASGRRNHRGERAGRLLAQLTGAEDAIVANNCAGATLLALQSLAAGKEVIVSRGQLVEIGGGFRLPEVFAAAGVVLREIGTTNRTYVHDYERAIGDSTGAIIRVHRSNFQQSGFVTEPTIDTLVACDHPSHIPIVDDLGSGCLSDLSSLGFQEPTVTDSVKAGADLTLFSGDKLFGGPQCGIVVGRKQWIDKLRTSPFMRAVRVDKITLAALEATIEIHLSGRANEEIPLLQMMWRTSDEIERDCQWLVKQLSPVGSESIEILSCRSQIGGGSLPGMSLASYAVAIGGVPADAFAALCRSQTPAIQPRVAQDQVLFDLRSVSPTQLQMLADGLNLVLDAMASRR